MGFIKVAAAVPFGQVADVKYNSGKIVSQIKEASENNASIVVFPEFSLTSYTCGDLFLNHNLISGSLSELLKIAEGTKELPILSVIGLPVIGTGDLSEIALGWSTYSGDHISMYNVNSSIPKTLVKFLIKWAAEHHFEGETCRILNKILSFPISPELLPTKGNRTMQKTEDTIGPYELHDFFLYNFVRFGFTHEKILKLASIAFKDGYDKKTIDKWLKLFIKRFMHSQWKKDCVPAGPKVGSIDLSPRGSWRMPSEVPFSSFIAD